MNKKWKSSENKGVGEYTEDYGGIQPRLTLFWPQLQHYNSNIAT